MRLEEILRTDKGERLEHANVELIRDTAVAIVHQLRSAVPNGAQMTITEYKKSHAILWYQGLYKLEAGQEAVRLCGGSWKAIVVMQSAFYSVCRKDKETLKERAKKLSKKTLDQLPSLEVSLLLHFVAQITDIRSFQIDGGTPDVTDTTTFVQINLLFLIFHYSQTYSLSKLAATNPTKQARQNVHGQLILTWSLTRIPQQKNQSYTTMYASKNRLQSTSVLYNQPSIK